MDFTDDEWLSFAQKLFRATDQYKLTWTGEDDEFAAETGYRTKVPGGSTYVLSSRDGDGLFPYVLSIFDGGRELASFTTVAYGDEWGHTFKDPTSEQSASQVLGELYSLVRRLVTGAPQKARELLDDLDSLLGEDPRGAPF